MNFSHLFTLGQVAPPGAPSMMELLLVSVVPTVVGLLLFLFGIKAEESGASKFIKWIAIVPLLVGVFVGYDYWAKVTGELGDFYRANYLINRKIVFYHMALYLPIAGLLGIGVWSYFLRRKGERPTPMPQEDAVTEEEEEYYEEEEYVDDEPLDEEFEEEYVEDESPEEEPPPKR